MTTMPNRLSLLVIFFCFFINAQAQSDKGYIGFSAGVAAPLGDFKDTKPFNANSGYALPGPAMELSTGILLGEILGVAALIRRQNHSIAEDAYLSRYVYPSDYTVTSETYRLTSFLGGLYTALPLNEQLTLDFRVLAGFSLMRTPLIEVVRSGTTNAAPVSRVAPSTGESFSFNAGAGLRYALGTKICLLLAIDFWSAGSDLNSSSSNNGQGGSPQTRTTSELMSLNAVLGLAWRL